MLIRLLFAASLLFSPALQAEPPKPPAIAGKAWLLADLSSDQILTSEKADDPVEPASLTKIMTAYVVFQALREKRISLKDPVQVSTAAWKTEGSRMFIEPNRPVSVEELIRGMVVQSGNDACVALAEHVASSEANFAGLMNREAKRLGMTGTFYVNSSGLPDPKHVTTANDLYRLARAMIRDFPDEYARYYSQKEFRYNNIRQLNRNRLLWLDPSVDGLKTGHTEAAGYCLVSSAKRGPRRLLSVLLGSNSESTRAEESLKLLNWGFINFDTVKLHEGGKAVKSIEIWKGTEKTLRAGFAADIVFTVPKSDVANLKAELLSKQPLVAPIAKGERVGTLRVTVGERTLGEHPLVALEAVPQAGIFGRAWDTLRMWVQ